MLVPMALSMESRFCEVRCTVSVDHKLHRRSSIYALDGRVNAAVLVFVRKRHSWKDVRSADCVVSS